jgi:exopolyphosphatase/guanosine-5'-triphosphate,3'-diphosphate pyrophosphatase
LPRGWRRSAMRLAILLRIAVLLNRSRNSLDSSALRIDVDKTLIKLEFDPVWLADNPLTVADLEREQEYLASTKYQLSY